MHSPRRVSASEELITRDAKLAIRLGELPPDTDAEQLTFELHAMILQANHDRQLLRPDTALKCARRAIERRLNPGSNSGHASPGHK